MRFKPEYRFGGTKIVVLDTHVKIVEDWSNCRSRSRAERRQRQGHRQNMVLREVPADPVHIKQNDTIVMHPDTYQDLRRQMAERARRMERDIEAKAGAALRGWII